MGASAVPTVSVAERLRHRAITRPPQAPSVMAPLAERLRTWVPMFRAPSAKPPAVFSNVTTVLGADPVRRPQVRSRTGVPPLPLIFTVPDAPAIAAVAQSTWKPSASQMKMDPFTSVVRTVRFETLRSSVLPAVPMLPAVSVALIIETPTPHVASRIWPGTLTNRMPASGIEMVPSATLPASDV